jgi:hypothetical protein
VTDDRRAEDAFFSEDGGPPPPVTPAPPRRESPLLARSPAFAALALAVSAWLLVELWPDVSFFLSSREPVALGGPGAFRLEAARENRLARVRGELAEAVPVTEARTGARRTVGRLAGTELVVDRPGRGGPPIFEGRLLPAGAREDYAAAVGVLRARGARIGDGYLVLRDGERPRNRWLPAAGSAILALLALVNLRALVRRLAPRN